MVKTNPRAVKYRRISDDREGRELGLRRQDEDLDALADRRGYTVVASYADNDIGASTRSAKPRPEYNRMLADAKAGRFDVILAYTTSRLTRRPLEHEALIELAEKHGIRYEYVQSPSFDLNTADGRQIARMLAAQDAAESERISERVQRDRLRQARDGRDIGGGPRPFGFCDDRVTVDTREAAEIVNAADAVLSGVSLSQIVADLRRRGVPTVTGTEWTTRTLRYILLRPRNAGLVVYQGDILEGVDAQWRPILPRDQWDTVRGILLDPRRTTTTGGPPKWLGSGLYRCGHPDCIDRDPPVTLRAAGRRGTHWAPRVYRCKRKAHLTRNAEPLDEYVEKVIVARMSRKDAVDLLPDPTPGVDPGALTREANALRARIVEAADLWEDGSLSAADFRGRRARLQQRLADVEERQRQAMARNPLAGLAGRADAGDVWKRLDLGRKRKVLAALLVVTVLPQGRGRLPGGMRLDPKTVDVQPAAPATP